MSKTDQKIDDRDVAVARVYSQALLGLAEKADKADDVREQLLELGRHAAQDEAFGRFVASPLIDEDQRSTSIDSMFRGQVDDLVVDTLQVMNRKGRLALLPALAEAYRRDLREARNRVDVHVGTAVPLGDALRSKLETALAAYTGKTPDLHEEVDENLIGGIVLRIGDRKVDASVQNEIRKYDQLLRDLAEREILGSREEALVEE
ncbi:MAG: ATP synthase F1 subunit delta [Acidobacteriota bacterium]